MPANSGFLFDPNGKVYFISASDSSGTVQPSVGVTLIFPNSLGQASDVTILTSSGSGWAPATVTGVSANSVTVATNDFSWWALASVSHATATPTSAISHGTAYLSANLFHDLSDAPLTVLYNDNGGDPPAITVHTATGALIRHLTVTPGASSATWDGKDSGGSSASSGLYFVAVRLANGTTVMRKLVVLKQ